jgi:hypothetical protein
VEELRLRAVPWPDGTEPVEWTIAGGRVYAREGPAGAPELPVGLERGSPELIAAHLQLQRQAGVLGVRDAGSLPGVALPARAEGVRVVGCGPFLAPPGFYLEHLYDGTRPERAVGAARDRVRAGWPWVKVIADFPGPDRNPLAPRVGYPLELVGEIAAAVHAEGGRIAAHVMGRLVRELVHAGVDSIEHGNWADDATVREMAARGTAWCPTLTTVLHHLEPIAAQVPPARELLDLQRETLPLAAELGVTLLAGTDEEPHGSVAAEVAALVRYGVPAPAAIAAATTGARVFLGLPGLEDGAPADLAVFDRDPREDVAALAAPVAVLSAG